MQCLRIRSQSADSSVPIANNDNKFDELIVGANTALYNRPPLTDFQGTFSRFHSNLFRGFSSMKISIPLL